MPESKAGDLVEVAVWQQQAAFTAGVLPVRWLTPLYWLGGLLLLIAYAVLALVLSLNKDWVDSGPLASTQPALQEPLAAAINQDQALNACSPPVSRNAGSRYKVVGGDVEGRPYYACYEISEPDGFITDAKVLEGDGGPTDDARIIKLGGAWPSHGLVTSPGGFVIGGAGLLVLVAFSWFYYCRRREHIPAGTSWTQRPQVMWLVGALAPVVGWLAVALWPQAPRGRRLRVLMQVALCYTGFLIVILFADAGIIGDHWAVALYGSLTVAMAYGVVAGRLLLWPAVEATVPATNGEAVHVFDPVEIQRALDRTYMISQGRLPEDLHAKVAEIRMKILDLLPHADAFPMGSLDLFVLQRTATDYLPTSIEAYLALPRTYAATGVLPGGKTALQVLKEQLDLLDWKIDDIGDAVRQRDSERLLAHSRFLEESFGRRSDELSLPPG